MAGTATKRRRKLWSSVASAFRFAERPQTLKWVPDNIRIPAELETPGAFDMNLFPHVEGVLQAADDPDVREIYLRWSTRNGKTLTALSIVLGLVSETGRPGMICSVDEERVNDLIDSEVWPMLEACEKTRDRLPPTWKRSVKRGVVIGKARIRRAFQKSKSKLASFPACYGLGNEVGLWSVAAIGRFRHRARLFPFHSLLVFEGKPEDKGSCAISHLCEKDSTQRRFRYVPCPHCGKHQRLEWGDNKPDSPGVKWEQAPDGRENAAKHARETAHYRCVNGCRIENQHRAQMMRAGVWVPEGCHVTEEGTIAGKPNQPARYVAFDSLSALYSLAIDGWGQLVAEWFDAKGKIESIKEFFTATLAQAWEVKEQRIEPHEIGKRLASHEPRGTVPDWGVFLTQAFDVQTSGGNLTFPWMTCAWGGHQRGHVVDYGVCRSLEDFRNMIAMQTFAKSNGMKLSPSWRSIDSTDGNVQEEVFEICRQFTRLLPRRGGSYPFSEGFRLSTIGATSESSARKVTPADCIDMGGVIDGQPVLITVNTERSQQWVNRQLDGSLAKEAPNRLTLCADAAIDGLLHEQLCNEHRVKETNRQGYDVYRWKRIDFTKPNDWRDVLRDCWTLAQLVTCDGAWWANVTDIKPVDETVATQQTQQQTAINQASRIPSTGLATESSGFGLSWDRGGRRKGWT